MENTGVQLTALDMGWAPALGLCWSWKYAFVMFPVQIGINVLMLVLGWVYHLVLGGEAVWVDVAVYILVMTLGFWLAARFSGPFQGIRWLLPILAAAVLALLIGWFTLYPPEGLLFRDLSAVGSWLPLPC